MKQQRGGFALGLVVGLLLGLVLALGVALYIAKVPVPFVNKVPQRSAEQDAAEAERNKNWDPNASLAGKPPVRSATAQAAASAAAGASAGESASAASGPARAASAAPRPVRDPAAILAGQLPIDSAASAAAPNASGPKSTKPGLEAFVHFVQAGAYSREEEAETQRARLAMMGMDAKVSEREQNGRTVFRVRLGPFDNLDEAEAAKTKLQDAGVNSALVHVPKR